MLDTVSIISIKDVVTDVPCVDCLQVPHTVITFTSHNYVKIIIINGWIYKQGYKNKV